MQHVLTSVAPLHMMGGLVKFGGEIQLTASRVNTSDGASALLCKLYTSPDFEVPLDSTYLVCSLVRETEEEEEFESTLVRRTTYNARTHDVPHLIELPANDDDDRLRVYVELKVQGVPESMVRGPRLSFCV